MEESTKQNTRNKIDIKNFSVHSFSLSYDDEHKDYIENSSKVVNSYLVNTPINTSETEISPGNFFCNKRDMAGLVLDNFQSRTDLLTNSENDPKQVQNISEETLVHPTKDNDLSNSSVNEESEISHTCKRKCDGENDVTSNIKKKTTDDKKIASLRKNIRDVMDENFLDTNTLAAQREESERLARVQEQQKLIRDYQRQRAANRQNIRTRDRILSLLQTNSSLTKTSTDDFDNKTETGTFSTNVSENISTVNAYLVNGVAQEVSLQQSSVIHSKRNILEEENITTNIVPLSSPIVSSDPLDKDKNKSDLDEIVTIVDSSSENDCILLSDDPEEEEEETEDDPQNSGLHVKDLYNVPDANGNVVVNIGHPKGEPDIFIAPQIARTIKPHQIGGVRFLYDNIIESIHRFNSSTGFGCILAHSMGLGKTLQVVCFCDIFLRHTESKTVLCVMPINTIQNWAAEFNIWTPKASENNEKIRPRTFNVFILNDQQKTLCARSKIIFQWAEEGGVLLMGYELFRLLALKLVTPKKKKNKSCSSESVETRSHKKLVEKIHMALVTPGPDLVICDEGHRIKNSHAGISVALKQIRTRRRIVLTGYPLQNNLLEYWCMVDFVRPNYLGTKTEFSNMFERPIQNGQCIDSTPEDIKLMRYRAHVLHSLLVGFVQRRSHIVLQNSLPSKLEYVLLTKMTSFQRKLYETFMNDVVRTKTVPNPLKAFAVCCKIWNHPDVLYNFLKKKDNDLDLEIEESETPDSVPKFEKSTNNNKNTQEILTNKSPQETSETNQGEIATKDKMKENLKLSKNLESQMINPQDSLYANQQYLDIYNRSNCYQNSSIESGFNDEMTGSNFWQDTSAPIDYASTTPTNILTSISADYNGTVFNETSNQESQIVEKKSSQIVDLDTKEIKTVETNIDYVDTKKFSGFPYTSSHIDTLKYSDKEKVETNVGAKLEKESLKNKGDDGIPYDWAFELMKDYEPENIENSPKIKLLFFILDESLRIGDRILLFSQSLLTLNLIEKFLQTHRMPGSINCWAKNSTYFRLDGSTTSLEREKLVNEFNVNKNIHLFLISTRAGSLGINLVGANRVIVFDASWNPCHDTQAVYRIYRYGQTKPCFVYRIVMDNCLEKKIYDRQVKKQGMSNRVVDECNPDPYLSMKDVTNLCFDYEEDKKTEYNKSVEQYDDVVMQKISDLHRDILSKEPFHHESLLIDRKEKKLSQAEKRLAQRSYEMEKKATTKQTFSYASNKVHCRFLKPDTIMFNKLLTPLRTPPNSTKSQHLKPTSARWIPAEVWQRQGMTAQEMVLPLDVVIPTHSNEKSNIVLKAGQKVMVLKSPKGIYMQLENGKIIAIRASNKTNQEKPKDKVELIDITSDANNSKENKNMSEKHISEEPLVVEKDNSNQNKKIKDENGQLSKHTCANNASTDDVIIINDSLTTKEDSSRKANLTIDLKASQSSSKTKETQFFGTNDKLCSIATASNNMSMNCDTQYPNNANFSKTSPRTNSHEISKYVHRQTCNASRNPTEMCFLQNRNLQDKSPESQRYPYLTAAQQKDENLNYIRSNNDLTKRPENYISHYSVGRHNSRQDYYEAPGNLFQTYKGQRDLSQNEASVNDPCLQTPTESINEVVRNCTMPERTHLQLANSEYRPNFLNPTPNLFKQDKFTNKTGGNKSATFVQPNGTRENFHHKEIQSSFNPTQEEYIATGNLHGESLQQQMMENNPVTAPYMVGGEGMHNQYLDTWLENPTINSIYDPQPHYGGDYSYVSQYRPHYNRVGFMSPQEHRLPHRYYMRWSPMSSDHASAFEPQSSISNHSQYSSQGNQWQRQQ